MKLGEGRERGSGVGGLDLDPASAGAGATWRRRATAELWRHQLSQLSSKATSEEEHHWEAGDVSECILLFGAFCNGEGREAVLYRACEMREGGGALFIGVWLIRFQSRGLNCVF